MTRHHSVRQDVLSTIFTGHEIDAGNHGGEGKTTIERLELHLGQPDGVGLVQGRVHALSTVRRRRPIFLLPPPPSLTISRSTELETLRQSVFARHVVDLYGPNGAGKSTVVATLVQELDLNQFPDGVVYIAGRLQGQDLLQALFYSFYESDISVKITPQQSHSYLRNLRVLVILDDVGLGPQQIDPILDALNEAAVLIVGTERTALGRGRALQLKGLPRQEAVDLFTKALPGTLSSEEALVVDQICAVLNDMPLPILSIAAQAARSKQTLAKLLDDLRVRKAWAGPGADLSIGPALEQIVLTLDASDRQLLTLIAAFDGPSVSSEALRSIIKLSESEFQEHVQHLQQVGLLRAVGSSQWFARPLPMGHSAPRLALVSAYQSTVKTWLVDEATRLQIINFYTTRLSRGDRLPGDELPNLLGIIEDCARQGWLDHLRPLVRAVDRSLAELGWWAEWQRVLDLTRRAAQAEGERALETWAMHQLGSVLGALGAFERAFQLLRTALSMREALGDQAGAALTAQNLDVLERLRPAPVEEPSLSPPVAAELPGEPQEPPAHINSEALPGPQLDDVRAGRRKLRLALLAALAILAIGTLALRFIVGVGVNKDEAPGLTLSWEFGDAWNALDNETWTQQIIFIAEGSESDIRFFADDEPVGKMFEVVLPLCDGARGTIRAESEGGESAEVEYEFDSPYCR